MGEWGAGSGGWDPAARRERTSAYSSWAFEFRCPGEGEPDVRTPSMHLIPPRCGRPALSQRGTRTQGVGPVCSTRPGLLHFLSLGQIGGFSTPPSIPWAGVLSPDGPEPRPGQDFCPSSPSLEAGSGECLFLHLCGEFAAVPKMGQGESACSPTPRCREKVPEKSYVLERGSSLHWAR